MKFNTCLILINDIEHVVKNATNTWKNIYNLHKKSDFVVNVSDKDYDGGGDDDNKKEEGNNDEEETNNDNIDDEEKEQEATEEDLPEV